jgi:hypothetical protein
MPEHTTIIGDADDRRVIDGHHDAIGGAIDIANIGGNRLPPVIAVADSPFANATAPP